MPTFGKDGKKRFHMNPQMGKALEERTEEKVHPGLHSELAKKGMMGGDEAQEERGEEQIDPNIHEKIANYDGHDHEGHKLASHVEVHHGGHPDGQPAMHEGHTHHTVSHPHPSHGSEPTIQNHESPEEALDHAKGEMHMGCAECEGHGTDANAGEEKGGDGEADGEDDGY